ncbi:MAG TPA: hypothetical protein VGM30_04575 [Puia sp.]|jgi:hypothetical protein
MKKGKLFIAAAAMLLVTAGVFAGKANKANNFASGAFYFSSSATFVDLVPALSTTASGSQAQVLDESNTPRPLYQDVNGTTAVYLP